jgi:hypothetical protein
MALDWETHKHTIEHLFSDEKRTLTDVMCIMEGKFKFVAR